MNVAVHQGTLYAFRSYFYGPAIDVAAGVQNASRAVLSPEEGAIFITGEVRRNLASTLWDTQLDWSTSGWLCRDLPRSRFTVLGKPHTRPGIVPS